LQHSRHVSFLQFLLLQLFLAIMAANEVKGAPQNLQLTAISAKDGASTIECWELAAPFVASSKTGIMGVIFAQLGKAGNVSYAIIPAKYDGGLHDAPQIQ